jgi:hypothetical protein
MKKALALICILTAILGIFALSGMLESLLYPIVEARIGRLPTSNTTDRIHLLGWLCLIGSLVIWWVVPRWKRILEAATAADEKISSFVRKALGRYFSFEDKANAVPLPFKLQDGLIFLAFFLYAGLLQFSRFQDAFPNVLLASDSANISSYAAGYDHPEMFSGDPILGFPERFHIYQAAIIPMIRGIAHFTNNYSLAFVLLTFPTVLIFLCSFYLLGRELFQSRYWGLLFAVLNAVPYYLEIDNTGIHEPVPRMMFQAVFPLILLLLWKLKEKPRLLILVSISMGLLVFIHAVSSPSWAAGLLLGYWMFIPKDWSQKRKIGFLVVQGLCLLFVMAPFIVSFSGNQNRSSGNLDMSTLYYIYKNNYPEGLLDVGHTIKNFLHIVGRNGLLYFSIVSLFIMFYLGKRTRQYAWIIILWGTGIFLVSIALPYSERIIERYLRLPPIETEFLRGIKHYFFLMILVSVWALSELSHRARTALIKYLVAGIGILFLGLLLVRGDTRDASIQATLNCIARGKLICGTTNDFENVILYLRDETPVRSGVFFAYDANDRIPLAVRYTSLRPLVYSHKDGGAIYQSPQFANEWLATYQEFKSHGTTSDWFQKNPDELFDFARGLGANFLVVELPGAKYTGHQPVQAVYHNPSYTVFSLDQSLP